MTILWLAFLPLAVMPVVFFLRGLRPVAGVLSMLTLLVLAVALMGQPQTTPAIVLGRSLSLSAYESAALALSLALLALTMLYGCWISQGELAYALTLGAVGFWLAAIMVRNMTISALLLEAGAIIAVMLVPSRRDGAAITGIRTLVLFVLAGPLILLAAWATENALGNTQDVLFTQIASAALAIGYGIALGVVPFHIWHPPVFRYGSTLSAVMLSAVFSTTLILRLVSTLNNFMWPGGDRLFMTLLVNTGIITTLFGSLMALPQRSVGRILAYTALADLGIVLIGLGIGTISSTQAALLHLGHRSVGIVTASMGLGILCRSLGDDDIDRLEGAWRSAPLGVIGLAIGGLSLAGLPLTAGFASRLPLYRALARDSLGWAVLLIVCTLGPTWAFIRCLTTSLVSVPNLARNKEAVLPGVLAVLLGAGLLLLGIWPNAMHVLPQDWWNSVLSGILAFAR
ncbi:MAG: hypothetical protein GX552_06475 [Chloroflexi bacterium]|nr:hypothetical protein [Chloroflexota bacterium]